MALIQLCGRLFRRRIPWRTLLLNFLGKWWSQRTGKDNATNIALNEAKCRRVDRRFNDECRPVPNRLLSSLLSGDFGNGEVHLGNAYTFVRIHEIFDLRISVNLDRSTIVTPPICSQSFLESYEDCLLNFVLKIE